MQKMPFILHFVVLICCLLASFSDAQPIVSPSARPTPNPTPKPTVVQVSVQWPRPIVSVQQIEQFGTPKDDVIKAADVGPGSDPYDLGNLLVGGYTEDNIGGPNAGKKDAFLRRYHRNGSIDFTLQRGGAGDDEITAVAFDKIAGDYYAVGWTDDNNQPPSPSPSPSPSRIPIGSFIYKFDEVNIEVGQPTMIDCVALGSTLCPPASGDDHVMTALAVDYKKYDMVYVGGTIKHSSGFHDGLVLAYYSNMTMADKMQIIAGPNTKTEVAGIAVDMDSGALIVAGTTTGYFQNDKIASNLGGRDMFIKKLSKSSRGVLWLEDFVVQFGTLDDDVTTAVSIDTQNGAIYVSGFTSGAFPGFRYAGGPGGTNAILHKFNVSGAHVWTRQFGPGGYEMATCVTVNSVTSDVYLVGNTYSLLPNSDLKLEEGRYGADGFVTKYNADGDEIVTAQIGAPRADDFLFACTTGGGGQSKSFQVGGSTRGNFVFGGNFAPSSNMGGADATFFSGLDFPTTPPSPTQEPTPEVVEEPDMNIMAVFALFLLIPIGFGIYWCMSKKNANISGAAKVYADGGGSGDRDKDPEAAIEKVKRVELDDENAALANKIKANTKALVDELKTGYENSVTQLEKDLKNQNEKSKEDLKKKLEKKRADLQKELVDEGVSAEEAEVKANAMVSEMEDVMAATQNDNLIKQIESITNKLNSECDSEVARLKKSGLDEKQYNDAVGNYKDQYNKKLALLTKELESAKIAEQNRLAKRLEERNRAKSKAAENKLSKVSETIQKTEEAAGNLRSSYEASMKSLEEDMKAKQEKQQRDLQKRLDNKKKKMIDEFKADGLSEAEATAKANEKLAEVEDIISGNNHEDLLQELESNKEKLNGERDKELEKIKKLGLKEEDFNKVAQQYTDLHNKKLAVLDSELAAAKAKEQERLAKRLADKKKTVAAAVATAAAGGGGGVAAKSETIDSLKSGYEASVKSLEEDMKAKQEKQQRDLQKRLDNKKKKMIDELKEDGLTEEEATAKANEKLAEIEDVLAGSSHEDSVQQLESNKSSLNADQEKELERIKKLNLSEEDLNKAVQQCKDNNNKKLALLDNELKAAQTKEKNRLAKRLEEKNKAREVKQELKKNLTSEYEASLKTLESDLKSKQEKHQSDLQKRLDAKKAQVVRKLQEEEGLSAEEALLKAAPIIEEEESIAAAIGNDNYASQIQVDKDKLKLEQKKEIEKIRSLGLKDDDYDDAVQRCRELHAQKSTALDSALETAKLADQNRLAQRLEEKKRQRAEADKAQEESINALKAKMESSIQDLELKEGNSNAESVLKAKSEHEASLKQLESDLTARHEKEQRDIQKRLEKKRADIAKRLEEEEKLSKKEAEAKATAVVKEEEKVLLAASQDSLQKQMATIKAPVPARVVTHMKGLDIDGDGVISEAEMLAGKEMQSAKYHQLQKDKDDKKHDTQKRLQERLAKKNAKKGGGGGGGGDDDDDDAFESPRLTLNPDA